MPLQNFSYTIQSADTGRIDQLVARLLNFSRARVRGLMDHEDVRVNDVACKDYGQSLHEGDRIAFRFDPQRKYKEKPAARKPQGFTLVYSDEHLVLVNKEAGLLTVPSDRREKNTLVDKLSQYLAQGRPYVPPVALVHRLDRDTSGLLVFGRNGAIAAQIIKQFAARKPEREYYAIVAGVLVDNEGSIRSFLQTDKALNQRSAASGDLAITHYRVLTRYRDATLVAVNLETGRRNQIRVHFAELGHPILGDSRYDSSRASHAAWPYKRLALHARLLGLQHPISGQTLRFEADLPSEFAAFAKRSTIIR